MTDTPNNHLDVILRDHDTDLAYAVDPDTNILSAYPGMYHNPKPEDYEWDTELEVSSISPKLALALRERGYHQIVDDYDDAGAIEDDDDD